jgi:uncharacterized protein (TIGR03435 family)
MVRASISARLSVVLLMCGLAASATAQSSGTHHASRMPAHDENPSLLSQVHIVPTTLQPGDTSIQVDSNTWIARGFDLKTLIAQIYDVDIRLVDVPSSDTADTRYDLTANVPTFLDQEEMQRLLLTAIQRKFGLSITQETRSMDVYVISAPAGPGTALHPHSPRPAPAGLTALVSQSSDDSSDDAGQITFMGKDCSGVSSGGITISDFRRTLEPDLDRVLLDETNLTGTYDFQIGNYTNTADLFKLLHDQLGLVVTPAQRKVTVFAVRPTQDLQASLRVGS